MAAIAAVTALVVAAFGFVVTPTPDGWLRGTTADPCMVMTKDPNLAGKRTPCRVDPTR